MRVSEILAIKGKVLFTIAPNKSVAEAVDIMDEQDVGSLVVFSRGQMVGMLTFREVMLALRQHGARADAVTVGEVMVKDPVTAFPAMQANDLRRLMIDKHSRYLPVMDGNTLMGVISFLDVAKAVLEEQSFENKMLKNYIKNWPDEPQA